VSRRAAAPDLPAMAALGIGQFGVLIALAQLGPAAVGAAQAALIFSLFPLLTLLLAAALRRERVTPALLAGVLLSIAGVALSAAAQAAGRRRRAWWGELAVLASA
jgi:drug/metabolite transporter (DMT)-like permease